jgi:hypothetical protein
MEQVERLVEVASQTHLGRSTPRRYLPQCLIRPVHCCRSLTLRENNVPEETAAHRRYSTTLN